MRFARVIVLLSMVSSLAQAVEVDQKPVEQTSITPEQRSDDELLSNDDSSSTAESILEIEKHLSTSQKNSSPTEPLPDVKPSTARTSYASLFVSYVFTSDADVPVTYFQTQGSTSVSANGGIKYRLKDAIKFGFEWSQWKRHSWNHGVLIDYVNFRPDSTTATIDGGGSSSTSATSGGVSILTGAYTGKYRWDEFYLMGALGYGKSTVDADDEFTKSMEARLYAFLGAGVSVAEKMNLEIGANVHTLYVKPGTVGNTKIVPSDIGYLKSMQLSLKFLF